MLRQNKLSRSDQTPDHTAQRQHLDPLPILQSLLLNGPAHPASRIFSDSS